MSLLYPSPLDSSEQQIRLLSLESTDPTPAWKLHTVTLEPNLHFAALSYVWGDKSHTTNISVNNTLIPVTTNLAAALQHVHRYWSYEFPTKDPSTFRIWIDFLCIDQSNTLERSSQVLLMPKVYTSAALVLGWLGDHGPDNNHELKLATLAVKVLGDAFRSRKWDPEKLSSDLSWLSENAALIQAPVCDKLWNGLRFLGSLPYWNRIWILQENVLARTVLYISPNAMIEKSTLMSVCLMVSQALGLEFERRDVQKPEAVPDHIWFKFRPPESTEFSEIREIVRFWTAATVYGERSDAGSVKERMEASLQISEFGGTLLASDERDHIYGLLGLNDLPIRVDYSQETKVRDVYVEYCRVVLDMLREMDKRSYIFLRDAGVGVFNNNEDLPSWAPNFPERATGEPTLIFGAKLRLVYLEPKIPFASLSGPVLSLAVVRIQSLERRGGSPTLKNLTEEGEVRNWCQDFVLRHESYPNQKIPALWVLFLVAMRMQGLVFDTSTMLLLQHFVGSLKYAIPNTSTERPRVQFARHMKTPEVKGISVGVELDGSQNPAFMNWVSPDIAFDNPSQSLENRMFEVRARLVFLLRRNYNARLFETDGGFLGMGPKLCEQGDIICLVDGYEDLVLLRKLGERYQYVGPCMVLGVSSAYIKNQLAAGEFEVETIELI